MKPLWMFAKLMDIQKIVWNVYKIYTEDGDLADLGKLQHITMYSAFLLSGIIDVLSLVIKFPHHTSQIFAALAFWIEGILFLFPHRVSDRTGCPDSLYSDNCDICLCDNNDATHHSGNQFPDKHSLHVWTHFAGNLVHPGRLFSLSSKWQEMGTKGAILVTATHLTLHLAITTISRC